MTSITTQKFNRDIIQRLIDDVSINETSSNYYIAVGRSNVWSVDSSGVESDPPPANRTDYEERKARSAIQSAKRVVSVSYVVPKIDWVQGSTYNAWSNTDEPRLTITPSSQRSYVLVDESNVFLCVDSNPISSSVIKPELSNSGKYLSDGYKWKFLYTMSGDQSKKFRTALFMPVQRVSPLDTDTHATTVAQRAVQVASVPGTISSIRIINNGGITDGTFAIEGDGTGASIEPRYNAGTGLLERFEVINEGTGYNVARVVASSDSGSAVFEVNISPKNGFGYDAREDLKSRAIMFSIELGGEEEGFINDGNYRQISILKNPTTYEDELDNGNQVLFDGKIVKALFNSESGNALSQLNFVTAPPDFEYGSIITGKTSGARAYVDASIGNKLYIHQDDTTGYGVFTDNEVIEGESAPDGTLDAPAVSVGDFNPYSGDMLYVENRGIVSRDSAQIENIKIVIGV